jgi:hypothetical protein
MYQGNDCHYLSCGASALNVILSVLRISEADEPATILDFGAGAGRVTRWIKAAFPDSVVHACDLRAKDMEFCTDTFGVKTWIAGTNIASLQAPRIYDLVWVGSVVTHLSADATSRLLDKLISWTSPSGFIVMSFHGRYALDRQNSGAACYTDMESWNRIQCEYTSKGFGYADYSGQLGYGISVTRPSWSVGIVECRSDVRLVILSERAWDNHHDILALQRLS